MKPQETAAVARETAAVAVTQEAENLLRLHGIDLTEAEGLGPA